MTKETLFCLIYATWAFLLLIITPNIFYSLSLFEVAAWSIISGALTIGIYKLTAKLLKN